MYFIFNKKSIMTSYINSRSIIQTFKPAMYIMLANMVYSI